MRVHFSAEAPVTVEKLAPASPHGRRLPDGLADPPQQRGTRSLLLVSKFGHCLNDLLFREKRGAAGGRRRRGVQPRRLPRAGRLLGVPFHHIPVTADTKSEAEAALLELVDRERSTWWCSPATCRCSRTTCASGWRAGDQHPPLVPAELQGREALPPGARPGREADRCDRALCDRAAGRGPDHRAGGRPGPPRRDPGATGRPGRDVECQALARAAKWHAEHRVLLNGSRTVVFH